MEFVSIKIKTSSGKEFDLSMDEAQKLQIKLNELFQAQRGYVPYVPCRIPCVPEPYIDYPIITCQDN